MKGSFIAALQGGSSDDMASIGRAIVENLAQLNSTFLAFLGVSGICGSFTFAAAATVVVPEPLVTANSFIFLQATNADAGTLVGSNESPYISAKAAGVSFTVATAAGTAAAGTEEFSYLLVNLTS